MSNFLRRHLTTALALLALLAACCLCDTLDRRPEPGKFAEVVSDAYAAKSAATDTTRTTR